MSKIAIVSRTFWPQGAAVEEALLVLAEKLSKEHQVSVVTLSRKDFFQRLQNEKRGEHVKCFCMSSLTTSSSSIPFRVFELLLFSLYTFFILCKTRPEKVYVATNPPVILPFLVQVYCRLFRKEFFYHLQDIHPEATEVVTGKKSYITGFLRLLDTSTMCHAKKIITLTEQMRSTILQRIADKAAPPIYLLENPSVHLVTESTQQRIKGFLYCGNAGRLQRIPLLLDSIRQYIVQGGTLPFIFAGGGVFASQIQSMANEFEQVQYLGVLPAPEAASLLLSYSYGLMPIEDDVTNFAFPSKSSSYVFSGSYVLAICGKNTSVAAWVEDHEVGIVAEPTVENIVDAFKMLEVGPEFFCEPSPDWLAQLTVDAHAEKLKEIILN